jgi:hypothetical protein
MFPVHIQIATAFEGLSKSALKWAITRLVKAEEQPHWQRDLTLFLDFLSARRLYSD